METQSLQNLLIQISAICRQYDKIAELTGENFNIFKVLEVTINEVRLHSSFIAELLDPKGSHGKKDIFLNLFIEQMQIQNFIPQDANVEVEKHIGYISSDKTEGGKIDIIVTDRNKNSIIIENKIYAGDQHNQLLRYYNYAKSLCRPPHLFYLTLDGKDASIVSKGKGKLKENDYTRISYSSDILKWLENCKEKSVNHSILRETITQYIYLIKYLTGQSTSKAMENEIISTIKQSPEYIKSAFAIANSLGSLKVRLITDLKNQLYALANELGFGTGEDPDFGHKPDTYVYFKFRDSKYGISIQFGFDTLYSDFLVGLGIEDPIYQNPFQENYEKLKKEISSKLSIDIGPDEVTQYKPGNPWIFLNKIRDLHDWNNPEPWCAIADGSLIIKIHGIINIIMDALKGMEL